MQRCAVLNRTSAVSHASTNSQPCNQGERLDSAQLLARYGLEVADRADYVMQLGEGVWMDASDPTKSNHTRYINHAEVQP